MFFSVHSSIEELVVLCHHHRHVICKNRIAWIFAILSSFNTNISFNGTFRLQTKNQYSDLTQQKWAKTNVEKKSKSISFDKNILFSIWFLVTDCSNQREKKPRRAHLHANKHKHWKNMNHKIHWNIPNDATLCQKKCAAAAAHKSG